MLQESQAVFFIFEMSRSNSKGNLVFHTPCLVQLNQYFIPVSF